MEIGGSNNILELDYTKENGLNIEQEDVWEVIKACFEENGIVQYQIRAFDHFLDYKLQEIVNNTPDIIYDPNKNDKNINENRTFDKISKLKFGNVSIVKPIDEFTLEPILPYDARIRNLYYCADIYIELIKETENINPELENPKVIKNKVKFGSIPMLVGSKYCNLSNMSLEEKAAIAHECPYDKGGYFISNGSEKAIVSQERMNINTPCVFKGKIEEHYYIEVRTISKDSTMSWIRIEYIAGNIYAYIEPSFKSQKIPLIVLFRALGVNNIDDIIHLVYRKNEPRVIYDCIKSNLSNIKLNNEITDKEKAINYLGAMTTHKNTLAIMHKYLLSHMGEDETSDIPKAFYIGNMINSLLNVAFGFRKQSDRDHYKNKRIDNVGELFTSLFRSKFRTLHKEIKKTFQRFIDANTDITDLSNIVKKNAITTALRGPISTGNWGKKKQGVSQPLARYNIISSLSHQRRINTHSEKQSKLVKPRHLHNSQFNLICPSETPEGQSVGLVKNLTMLSTITIHTIKEVLYPILNHHNMIYISETDPYDLYKYTKIFINGEWVGNCEEPEVLVKQLRYYRRLNTLARETSITYNKELTTIFIYTNQGRLTRPVFILDEDTMELKLTKKDLELVKDKEYNWSNLIQTGRVEYIDAEESENLLIAISFDEIIASKKNRALGKPYKHFTHVEMHPSVMLGISASYIPFANHNQAPRNTYQCLDPEELVLMSNGNRKAIKYIKEGDEVYSFNPTTLNYERTKIINQYIRKTNKKIYKLITISGREITATEDHKFMTNQGWKQINEFNDNTLVGISLEQESLIDIIDNKLLLSKEIFINTCNKFNLTQLQKDKYIIELEKLNYFNLKHSNFKVELLSKIIGFVLSDGSLNYYINKRSGQVSFSCSNYESALKIVNDIKYLGFGERKIMEGHRICNGVNHHTFDIIYNGVFPILLIALETTYGKKTTQKSYIPKWINEGNKKIKRGFLTGLFSGDGSKIRFNRMKDGSCNFVLNTMSMSIVPEYINSLTIFFENIKDMLEIFNIKVNYINQKNGKYNKSCIHLGLSSTDENLITFYELIGYTYDIYKNQESGLVIEYLKYKKIRHKKHIKFIEQIRKYIDEGLDDSTIANIVNMKAKDISDIKKSYNNNRKIRCPKNKKRYNLLSFEEFNNKVEIKNNHLFIPLESMELQKEKNTIADITTESNNHSFIAGNNFLVHNSAMGKQAMGVYASNHKERMDSSGNTLWYPEKALVNTQQANLMKLNELPSGQNIIVAVACYGGYNQEDSLIMNKSSVERGLFRSYTYKTIIVHNKANGGTIDIGVPKTPNKGSDFSKLDSQGIIKVGVEVKENDVIVAKTFFPKENEDDNHEPKDTSRKIVIGEEGYIDNVIVTNDADNNVLIKIKIRSMKIPEMGDKFSCYTPDHEILTDNGWIGIDKVTKDNIVATLDPVTQTLKYEKVEAVQLYNIENEDIYEVNTQQISLKTTINHNMYIKKRRKYNYELIQAQNIIGKRVKFLKNIDNGLDESQCILPHCPIPNFEKIEEFLFLFGFWIGDGWVENYITPKGKRTYRITICQVKLASKTRIINCIRKCGLYPILNGDKIHIYHKPLTDMLNMLSVGAPNKYLPEWCFKLNKVQSLALLNGLMDSDGSINATGSWSYSTSSIQLKDDVQKLALHCGFSANVSIYIIKGHISHIKGREIITKYDQWQVRINRLKNSPTLNHGHTLNQNVQTENVSKYTGSVHCVTVRTGIIYIRRKGKTVWCGNSRHGQKGTVGLVMPQENMPFNRFGASPDIIMNPHALPSRMTIAQLLECVVSKAGALKLEVSDGTSFTNVNVEDICDKLANIVMCSYCSSENIELETKMCNNCETYNEKFFKYERHGNETLYNGFTGEKLEAQIFVGPVYYQRLKHLVANKIHARSRGPTQILTRQPLEGRCRQGGLRLGEMEVNSILANGSSAFIKGRTFHSSDPYQLPICSKCGYQAIANSIKDIYKCLKCKNSEIHYIDMPYATKLLTQEQTAMGIGLRMDINDTYDDDLKPFT